MLFEALGGSLSQPPPRRVACPVAVVRPAPPEGSASDLLVERSVTASLLVPGSRARDPLVDLVLGSTSRDVLAAV